MILILLWVFKVKTISSNNATKLETLAQFRIYFWLNWNCIIYWLFAHNWKLNTFLQRSTPSQKTVNTLARFIIFKSATSFGAGWCLCSKISTVGCSTAACHSASLGDTTQHQIQFSSFIKLFNTCQQTLRWILDRYTGDSARNINWRRKILADSQCVKCSKRAWKV